MGRIETASSIDQSPPHVIVEGSADLHSITTIEGVYEFASPASRTLFGWDPDVLVDEQQLTFVHPDDAPLLSEAADEMSGGPGRSVSIVYRFRRADGSYRWVESLSRLMDRGGEPCVISVVRDVEERQRSERVLLHQASTDPLTGLANRSVFMDRLEQALRRLERRDGLVAVLFLDLDRFKLINDSVGHHMGDAVLSQMAERLRTFLRPEDTLARLGGDEFAVVVEDMSTEDEVRQLGKRIIEAGRRPFVMGADQFSCTTSVGIAISADPKRSAEGLLQEADLALYRAKDRGRDRAEMFDEALRTRAVGRLGTERMLRRAITEDRLRVEFQPIVDLATGLVVGAEALVRVWDPDAAELIVAEAFIGVAEEAGLLPAMDAWILGETINQAAAWRTLFADTAFADISINVTARHLADPGFAESLLEDLAARGLPADALQIEVTERVLMEASNSAMTGLNVLRDGGVKVGLDDFGTGFSSLSHLRDFPLNFVKIDRSFVAHLPTNEVDHAIVASVIHLSHALGMHVVAEGVETQEQLDHLERLGCDRAQGFLFAAAGPPDRIEALVSRGEAAGSRTEM